MLLSWRILCIILAWDKWKVCEIALSWGLNLGYWWCCQLVDLGFLMGMLIVIKVAWSYCVINFCKNRVIVVWCHCRISVSNVTSFGVHTSYFNYSWCGWWWLHASFSSMPLLSTGPILCWGRHGIREHIAQHLDLLLFLHFRVIQLETNFLYLFILFLNNFVSLYFFRLDLIVFALTVDQFQLTLLNFSLKRLTLNVSLSEILLEWLDWVTKLVYFSVTPTYFMVLLDPFILLLL